MLLQLRMAEAAQVLLRTLGTTTYSKMVLEAQGAALEVAAAGEQHTELPRVPAAPTPNEQYLASLPLCVPWLFEAVL